MIDTGSLTPEPTTAEPREAGKPEQSPWRTKAKAAVSAWLAQWGVLVTVVTAILLFVSKCGMDIQRDRLKADFDRLGERIDGTSNTLNEKIDGVNAALTQRIDSVNAALTQRIDGQTELLNERIDARTRLLDQKIESQSVLLTKELKRVEAQLGARIDRIESAQRQAVPATLPNRSSADGADGVRFTGRP